MKKAIEIINRIILAVLAIVLVFVCYAKYIKQEAVIKIGGYAILIVLSESMEPTIHEKELILIKEADNYELGDIVSYVDLDDTLITHRIMQIDEYSFITKGDNNDTSDENRALESIQGKVVFHSKILGIFVLYYLKILIIMYLVAIICIWLYQNKQEKPEEGCDENCEENEEE